MREACLPEQEMNLISDQSQESLPVFSPKKMTRRSTMFCSPPKSPSTDEPAEETRSGTFNRVANVVADHNDLLTQ